MTEPADFTPSIDSLFSSNRTPRDNRHSYRRLQCTRKHLSPWLIVKEVGGEVEEQLVEADWEGLRLQHGEVLPEVGLAEEDYLLCCRPERVLPPEVGLAEVVHPRYGRLAQSPLVHEGGVDRGRGGSLGRGRSGPAGGIATSTAVAGGVKIADSVQAIGVKRPAYGTLGAPVDVLVNCFRVEIPKAMIYHYDTILPGDRVLPKNATMEIIRKMQEQNPNIFTKRGVYDGRKNLYSSIAYSFGDQVQFEVEDDGRNPRRVRIQFAAMINPASTALYLEGPMSRDNQVLTTLNACNVAIRTQLFQYVPLPVQILRLKKKRKLTIRYGCRDHSFNTRSFFPRAQVKDVGRSVELLRGFFQSVRPVIGKTVMNVDISSAAFYKSGPLIKVCLEYLGRSPDPTQFLSASRLEARTRRDLLKFIRNLNVRTQRNGESRVRAVKDISERGADTLTFLTDNGGMIPLQAWFLQETGQPLRYPGLACVQLSRVAWVPLECCDVVPGQFYRKTLTPDQVKHMVEFSRLWPQERLQSIRDGIQALGYGSSTYLRDFGINVDPNPLTIKGRILAAPTLLCGQNVTIQPREGRWNMRSKTLFKPEKITGCAILIYDQGFESGPEEHLKRSLFDTTRNLGIQGMPPDPPVLRKIATRTEYWRAKHLQEVRRVHKAAKGSMPNLIIVVLPDFGWEDIYTRVKNAGNIRIGVVTLCLKASKCAPTCTARINVTLGGINVIPKPGTVPLLADKATPTIVIGADLRHPEPGATLGPRLTQPGRMQIINDLTDMIAHVIKKYMQYRKEVEKMADLNPQRILFYREGISEDQFKKSKEVEVPQILQACDRIGIPRPKLTFVVAGRLHHIQFFPTPGGKAGWSGNAPAGLVVDRGITSPVEYDSYLQSHPGVHGTNRSTHYNVLVDQNNLMPIAPIYYARMACKMVGQHYDPDYGYYSNHLASTSQSDVDSGAATYEALQFAFESVHGHIGKHMHFQ